MVEFYDQGHLGGSIKGGDDATFYPKMWDFFISQLKIQSVLDIGCGEGQALAHFKDKCRARGIEGCLPAIDNSAVKELISAHDFTQDKFLLNETYDMVWCCEFVEHVDSAYQDYFLETIRLSKAKYVFLTHAFPNQGGFHHVNCQNPSYWIYHLGRYGYELSPQLTRMARTIAQLECSSSSNHFARSGLVFIKKQEVQPRTDALITWASGKEFCQLKSIRVFVNSLNATGFEGDKIVFTHDMEIESREYFMERGFQVIDVDPNEVEWVVRDRFLHWYRFLDNSDYRHVMLLDAKDVVFQRNPIEFLEEHKKPLYFVSEGKRHQECDWNTNDQKGLQVESKKFQMPYENWEVICGGTILGYAHSLKRLIMQIWSTTLFTNKCTDQAVLNFLYNGFFYADSDATLINPIGCCLVATADLPSNSVPYFHDGILYNRLLGEPYYIWHQWDRTEHKNEILEKYA